MTQMKYLNISQTQHHSGSTMTQLVDSVSFIAYKVITPGSVGLVTTYHAPSSINHSVIVKFETREHVYLNALADITLKQP